ncbi:MAG: hypothetical protein FJ395_21920 [Verrucomicrobia bacterium]|nr:hypothetical protein [Verrucomicrobiota bacterium]
MPKQQDQGKCARCGKLFGKRAMTNHLKSCGQSAGTRKGKPGWHLVVEAGPYWLHLFAPASATLRVLDGFLRAIWLECCGHMSAFTINGVPYHGTTGDGMGGRSMSARLDKVLRCGMEFEHEYDFGTSTDLRLKVAGERWGQGRSNTIQLLARNEPPEIPCGECGKPAAKICSECSYEPTGWLCPKCAKKHACGEDMMLPVVNSPRTGVCGYVG